MNRTLKTAGSVAAWVALAAYLVWAVQRCNMHERDLPMRGIEVVVSDSADMKVITPGMVRAWIASEKLIQSNSAAHEVPLNRIDSLVRSRKFVESAEVYMDMKGILHITVTQRHPIVRFSMSNGYDFYLTQDAYVLPAQPHAAMLLPLVTGSFTPPFPKGYAGPLNKAPGRNEKKLSKNYLLLYKLINFVEFINDNDFRSALIEQINLVEKIGDSGSNDVYNTQIELIPRAGNHIVLFGDADNYEAKINKLIAFYRNGLPYEGWNTYRYIDLKYKNQIVCTK